MQPGDVVLLRSIYRGNVRWAFPHRYAGTWDGRYGLYCAPGTPGRLMKRALGGGYLREWVTGAPARPWTWTGTHVLRFMRPQDAHTVELFWSEGWEFRGWYVNLQAPLVVDGTRFDTTDWALDLVVTPDGAPAWKDEDDFAEAIALGVFDARAAAEVRAEGERVLASRPWPTGWEAWRPPPEWTPPPLPADWDRA